MSNVGKNLKPVQFGFNENVPSTVDQFGQGYDSQKDSAQNQTTSGLQSKLDHSQSDVDSSPQSQHHTLGTNRNQSSPGDHNHDGTTSRKLGTYQMDPSGNKVIPQDVLTGSKGGNVALTNLINMLKKYIDFTDSTT